MTDKIIPWDLIISHLKQETDKKEEAALNEWRNSDGNESLFMELESLWREVQAEAGEYDPDVSYYWKRMEARMQVKRKVYTIPVLKYRIAMVAASLLLVLSVSISFFAGRITGRPGIIAFFSPVDKKLHTRLTVMTAETIVVCRPLITEQRYLRQRRMDAKFLFVVKNSF